MNKFLKKNTPILTLFIKLLIVAAAFYFIYHQLSYNKKLNWAKFNEVFYKNFSFVDIIFIIFLSFLNRYLEILKWQNLVKSFQKIPLATATKQVLAALTVGIFTPNGIGEYAGKALYFNKKYTKKIVLLNLICNGVQMIVAVVFGIIGLWVVSYQLSIVSYWFLIKTLISLFFVFCFLAFILKKITIKGYSIKDLFHKINEIPKKIHRKNNYLAIARYLTFSHQYYFLFIVFGVQLPYFTLMATIAVVYFIASSLPSLQVFDFAVKGGVAVYFFGLLAVNEWIVVFISTIMWFLNVVIPVIMGSYFVLKFQDPHNKTQHF